MSYTQNLDIRDTALRHGYITKNDRVHTHGSNTQPIREDNGVAEGGLGFGNHSALRSIFNHPNAVIDRQADPAVDDEGVSDFSIPARITRDRDNLSGLTLIQEINARIDTLTEDRSTYITTQTAVDPVFDENTDDTATNMKAVIDLLTAYAGDPAANSIVDAIAADSQVGTAFNPDFPLNDVSFVYNPDRRPASNRAASNDKVSSTAKTPNIAFPSNGESLSNPDVEVTYAQGRQGGGQFGTTHEQLLAGSVNNTDPIIADILNAYTGS